MIQFRKSLICSLFCMITLFNLAWVAEATTMNFTVHGGEEEQRTISLAIDDRVVIKFTVLGQTASTLDFRISYPNGTSKDFAKLSSFDYSFVCDDDGEYVLIFSNEDSAEDRLVTLDYEVEHYIFGMPQMLFLTLIIVLVCVAAVAVFILMGKPR